MTLDSAVFLKDDETGRLRKFKPGEHIPSSAHKAMRDRMAASAERSKGKPAARATAATPTAPAPAPAPNDPGDNGSNDAVVALGIDVAESTVKEIEVYLEANPAHADAVMAAEEASRNKPRKGVVEAVEEANEA